jgi:hypothetical protein
LKTEIVALVILVVLSVLVLMPLSGAYTPTSLTLWTDKSQYAPGDAGTLYIAFYNNIGRTLAINGITIVFESWRSYDSSGGWLGNQTIEINRAFVNGEIYYNSTRFLVPTDGRANSTVVTVTVTIAEPLDIGVIEEHGYINVHQAPRYEETVVTLLTILLVLIIICTAIISATMFISARRSQPTSRIEAKQ